MANYTPQQLQQIWIQAGGDPNSSGMAAAIALAESGGDPNSTNHNTNGTTDRGLWQINSIWGGQSTYDPLANARAAVSISKNGSDWNPWSTFKNGAWKKFVNAIGNAGTVLNPGAAAVGAALSLPNPLDAVAKAITDVFNTAVSDLKYGAVLLVVLAAAGFMMVHGIRGTLQGRGAKA